MRAYVINIMVVLIIFPVILQTVINVIVLSIGGQGALLSMAWLLPLDCLTQYAQCTFTLVLLALSPSTISCHSFTKQ